MALLVGKATRKPFGCLLMQASTPFYYRYMKNKRKAIYEPWAMNTEPPYL
jgi:hypothetical protein